MVDAHSTPASSVTFPVIVTFFHNAAAGTKIERSVPLNNLADRIRNTHASAKSKLPWLELARFDEQKTAKRSRRHDANVQSITGIEADYDGEELQFQHALAHDNSGAEPWWIRTERWLLPALIPTPRLSPF
jgi:hypothetical protein